MPFWVVCVRFRRDSVCTAVMPESFLSTYIAHSSGWSKPVWNLFATIMTRYWCALELLAQIASSTVHGALCQRLQSKLRAGLGVLDGARERHEGPVPQALSLDVPVDLTLVADCTEPVR